MSGGPAAKRRRGRPRKSGEQLRRDQALAALDNLQIWFMVESKRRAAPRMSVKRACELIVVEASTRREAAPRITQEMLDRDHKYLLDADTLRRRYARAEALRRKDRSIAEYCTREIAKIGSWATRPQRVSKDS